MKVICIDDNFNPTRGYPHPSFGDVDTVIDEGYVAGTYIAAYELERFPGVGCAKSHFAPLSEIDETTFSRNYQTENA